jgi:3-hydroxyisobutyrate dehydrogenase-like beta-hydroxyacid dehydrogenase
MSGTRTVAVLGTGRMGGAMAATLRRAGYELVLWNRDTTKAKTMADELEAKVSATPAEAAAAVDFVLSSLADDKAVKSVYLGAEGVTSGIRSETVAIDTSTIDPETTRQVGAGVDAVGASFLDCPVSGSVSAVEAGTLTIMAGGSEETIERARPVLSALASRIVPTGDRGSGSATKLAVNALVHGLNVALSESLVLAERAGIDRLTAYEVFASGAGGAPFVHYKRHAFEHPEDAAVGFTLELVQKDLELITGLADRVGTPMEQARVGLQLVERAVAAGYGDADLSALAVFLRSR